ncbi:Mur ligase family protein [uncultured Acetobacteroides sp.]|uniref:UDP-N-acetylmuramate--L-alanine ligase n=1 Tax=uncultured Acetobacteroides sp. TaxID=1760811 RepID=UPI0029F5A318|nr:Mur ligase family protein [uncultured Acetobacteroides sp.]
MRVHFIAIGGSAMHNLALALHQKGYTITGSDDEIFEPSRTRLEQKGILPSQMGWFPERITTDLDAVILGMHAREDNPELVRAKELGVKIYSYPEYLYEQTKNKCRIVVGGSHGKTSTTAMVMHVLRHANIKFDYMVGAQLDGFDTMVSLSDDAKYAVFEGDEYLTSPIDRRPKFHLYKPNIGLVTGIAWDHINVFPTFDFYVKQFEIFSDLVEDGGTFIYFGNDAHLSKIAANAKSTIKTEAYATHPYEIVDGICQLIAGDLRIPLKIFGEHNLQNIAGAKAICNAIGVSDNTFYNAIATFAGAAKRLQLLASNKSSNIYLDFAHSPSKLMATTKAVKEQFPNRKLVACMELHTFSSLNKDFLSEYNGTMSKADVAYVYFNPETIKHKQLPEINPDEVKASFGGNVEVFTESEKLIGVLRQQDYTNANLLIMTSGNFSGVDLKAFALEISNK